MSIDIFSVLIGLGIAFSVLHAIEMHRDTRGGL